MLRSRLGPFRLHRRHDRWIVAALVLAGGALRAWHLDGMSIWQDEGLSLYRATRDASGVLSGLIPLGDLVTRDVHPPLYFLTLAGWLRLVGIATWSARWLSWLFLLPMPAATWALGRATVGRTAALAAAALTALSPLFLWYAQEIRSYGLVALLGLVAVYALWRSVTRPAPRAARRGWAVLGAAATGALLWTHYLGFMLIPVLVVIAVIAASRRRTRRALAPLALLALVAAPLLPFAIDRLGLGAERDQHFVPLREIALDVFRGFGFGRTLYAPEALAGPGAPVVWGLIGLLALMTAAGVAAAWRARPSAGALLLSYLALPVLSLYAVTLVKPIYLGAYHLIVASPPFYILVAAGLTACARRSGAVGLTLGALVVGTMLVADARFHYDGRFAKDDLRALAAYVDERAVPGDVLALSDPVLERSFEHLVRRVPIVTAPRMLVTATLDDRPPEEQLAPLLAEHGRVWFMTPLDAHRDWLERHAERVDREAFHGATIPVHVTAYEARRPAPDLPSAGSADGPAADSAAAWSAVEEDLGGLHLHGWSIEPEPLRSGAAGRVRLLWSATAPGLPDYKVAVRLLDASGRDWADGDHEPFHGERPVSGWSVGSPVPEPHDLLVRPGTPPGSYRVGVTVYDPVSGERHPADAPRVLGTVPVAGPTGPLVRFTPPGATRVMASGRRLDILAAELPGMPRPPGERIEVGLWLRARGSDGLAGTLRADVLGGSGRTVSSADVRLEDTSAAGEPAPGEVRKVIASVRLPAKDGRYRLRLRLLGADGRPAWFLRGGLVVRGVWVAFVTVAATDRHTEVPASARQVSVDVGDAIRLVGLAAPEEAPVAGSDVPVTLYWTALRSVDRDYHVTVQALPLAPDGAPGGPPAAQVDGVPASGTRPTTGWTPGEVVVDRHVVSLPVTLAPGRYRLMAALYDPEAPGSPRPTVRQDGVDRDHISLLDFTIVPPSPNGAVP